MKKILAFILLVLFTFHIFDAAIIYLRFKVNQDYIAEFLCINKDVPESTCKGCCQLKKEITEQEEKKQKQEALIPVEKQVMILSDSSPKLEPIHPIAKKSYSPIIQCPAIEGNPFDVFHPPSVYSLT